MSRADQFQHRFEHILGVPFSDGNSVVALRNGDEIFPAMLEAIEQATGTIEFLTFVYWTGGIAERFARALAGRARAGVEVRVLLDSYGAMVMPRRLAREMQAAGVEVCWFRPLATLRVWTLNHRTHRKVLVCDGRVAFTGGVGIAEQWEGDGRNPREWRDTHFRIVGPAVAGLRSAFWGNWMEAVGHIPVRLFREADADPAATMGRPDGNAMSPAQRPSRVQVVRSSASLGWNEAAALAFCLIVSAERRIRISTAYFSPDGKMTDHLIAAVERGVEVTILIPGAYTDSRLPLLASGTQIARLLRAGAGIWRYRPTMLHTKIIIVDDLVSCIGSANLNQRSPWRDEEVSAVVISPDLAHTLTSHFKDDLERSDRLKLDGFERRGVVRRAKEALVGLIKRST